MYFDSSTDNVSFVSFIIVLGVTLIIWRYIKKSSNETKYNLFKYVILFSPAWLLVLVFAFFYSLAAIQENTYFGPSGLAVFSFYISVYLLIIVYCFLTIMPATIARDVVTVLVDLFKRKKSEILSYWSLLAKTKEERLATLSFLFILLAFVLVANGFILTNGFASIKGNVLLIAIYLVMLLLYPLSEILKYGKVYIPETDHTKKEDLKRVIENISIRTGVAAPDFKILAHNNPTAFSIYPNFKKPVIYITAPLLNLADNNELEAVISHEFAHIYSGRILYFQRVNNLLIFLRTFSYLFFLILLASFGPIYLAIWLAYAAVIGVQSLISVERVGENSTIAKAFFTMTNPPYALIKFLSYLIYYAAARDEEFYADLKTIDLTRYPEGIYSILQKLGNLKGITQKLPEKFGYLYFTGENTTFQDIPMAQPTVQERQANLEETDETLASLQKESVVAIKCPACAIPMDSVFLKTRYDNFIKSYFCKNDKNFWFDDWAIWCVSDSALKVIDLPSGDKTSSQNSKLICPKCGVELVLLIDKNLPADIKIWYCSICNGSFISKDNIIRYIGYRQERVKTSAVEI